MDAESQGTASRNEGRGVVELSYFGSVEEVEIVLGSPVLLFIAAILLTRFLCLGAAGLSLCECCGVW